MPNPTPKSAVGTYFQSDVDAQGFKITNLGGTSGTGTVTSVALTAPSTLLTVTGSPITGSGTLALSMTNAGANTVFGNFTGSSANPTFNSIASLVTALGLAPSATTDTTNASNITSGTLGKAEHPATTVFTDQVNTFGAFAQTFQAGNNFVITDSSDVTRKLKLTLSGITPGNTRILTIPDADSTVPIAASAPANNFVTGINSNGILLYAQPAFSGVSGTVTSSQLPNPSASTLGGVKSYAAQTNQFLTSIGTDGTPVSAQPAFTDISGTLAISMGGSGQVTANASLNAFLPSQTSNAGKFLTTDGAGATSWATVSGGGSFTNFSIVNANGFYGSVANATTAPALTLYLADSGDATKKAHFVVSGVTAGQDRAITVPNAASTLVVADTGSSNNFLTAISASGAISKAQPSATNLSNGVTGSGAVVLAGSPTLTAPNIGAAVATQISGLTSPVTPNAAGGTDLGSVGLPFANAYVGGSATNNIKITGTATAARTFTLPDANCNPVQPDTGASNNFLTAISSAGVISKAQPAFSNISGIATATQGGTGVSNSSTITLGGAISTANSLTTSGNFALTLTTTAGTNVTFPTTGTLATLAGSESLTNKKLGSLTTNGFVKTSGGDGTLSVDTGAYITASSSNTLTNKISTNMPETQQTLTDGATVSWDTNSGGSAKVTLGGNRTLSNPTNTQNGAIYVLEVIQDGTGSRTLSYGTNFVWPAGTAPTLTTTLNKRDLLTFYCSNSKLYGISTLNYA